MKISYIAGICVKNDAISNSVRDEVLWLSSEKENEVRIYTHACDYADLPLGMAKSAGAVALDQHFQSSDLVVFHFGIFYPLFNLIPVTPKRAKRLVVFHNITPKQFVPIENHSTMDQSFAQMANIMFAEHVVCDSQTNLDFLLSNGIQTPATVLPLAIQSNINMPEGKPSKLDGVVRLAFIGRIVQSKGPEDLLEALLNVLQRNQSIYLEVNMICSMTYSDLGLAERIRKTIEVIHALYAMRARIAVHENASEEMKCKVLQNADLFVLPTYHEGFCVPILEALGSGCKVIAYDNTNVPAISGGFARLTPTGDVIELSYEIEEVIEEIVSSTWQGNSSESYVGYTRKVRTYVQQFSLERSRRRFLNFIRRFVS